MKKEQVLVLAFHTELSIQLGLHDLQLRSFHAFLENVGDVHIVATVDDVGFCQSVPTVSGYKFNGFLHCVPKIKENPSISHGRTLNWAMDNIVERSRFAATGVFIVDGDLFPVRTCDLLTLAQGEKWSCLLQTKPGWLYCWPGALALSVDILPAEPLDFRPVLGADTGAQTKQLIRKSKPQYIQEWPCDLVNDTKLDKLIAAVQPPCLGVDGDDTPPFMHLVSMTSTWFYNASFIRSSLQLLSGWKGWAGPPPVK